MMRQQLSRDDDSAITDQQGTLFFYVEDQWRTGIPQSIDHAPQELLNIADDVLAALKDRPKHQLDISRWVMKFGVSGEQDHHAQRIGNLRDDQGWPLGNPHIIINTAIIALAVSGRLESRYAVEYSRTEHSEQQFREQLQHDLATEPQRGFVGRIVDKLPKHAPTESDILKRKLAQAQEDYKLETFYRLPQGIDQQQITPNEVEFMKAKLPPVDASDTPKSNQ